MKRILFIYLLLTCQLAFAQQEDSLIRVANTYQKGDSTRLKLLGTAAWGYQLINIDKALKISQDGLAEAKKYKDNTATYRFLVTEATIQQTKSNFENSIALFKEAINFSDSLNKKKWLHTCYNNLGNTYYLKGDVQLALACFEKSIDIQTHYDKDAPWADKYNNIGAIYYEMKDYSTALKKFRLSLTDTHIQNNLKIRVFSNITNLFCGLHEKDSANKYLQLLKILVRQDDIVTFERQSYYFSSLEYFMQFDIANVNLLDAYNGLEIARSTNDETYVVKFYTLLMAIFSRQNNLDSAISYGEKSKNLHQKLKDNFNLKVDYDTLASLYYKQGKIDQAYQYLSKASIVHDSIFNEETATATRNAEVRYDTKQKEEKSKLLEKEKNNEKRLKNLYLLLGIIGSLSIGLFFLYRKNKQEKLLKQNFAIQLLNAQEEERQRIAKDLHDSVGQNILFIKNQLQSPTTSETKVMESIDLALEEVRTISKDLYPNQLEKYGLTSAVEALSEQVKNSTGIFVSADMQGIDEALTKNVQINFYRIIQEFVNNTIKHAEATAIRITTELSPTQIKLIVQDNGKGFDKSILERKAKTSFGLLNMEERIKMLKGKVDIESEIGKGTKSTFTIPIQ